MSAAGSADRRSTSIQRPTAIAFTDVPPPTRPTLNVVFGSRGTWRSAICAIGAAERVHGIRDTEGAVAVPARSLERDPVAQAADADVRNTRARRRRSRRTDRPVPSA